MKHWILVGVWLAMAFGLAANAAPVVAQCTLLDDMESGQQPFWSTSQAGASVNWAIVTSAQAESPTHVWYVPDAATIADHYLDLSVNLSPPFQELRFHHTYEMENLFDGGVLEVSTDGGATFADLGGSILEGGYDGLISNATGNPIGGRMAWTGGIVGSMTQVRVDLSAYVGSSIIVRFRQASDASFGSPGWQIDDIRFCEDGVPVSLAGVEPERHHLAGGSLLTVFGSGLNASVSLAIRSGATTIPLGSQVFANGALMAGTIPAAAVGTYDIVAMDGGGNDLFVLDDAVSIVEALLPPPGDVEAVRLGDEARLTWANLVAFDSIRVLRNGAMIDLLDGSATAYVDDISGLPVGNPIDYEIIGTWNGIDSYGGSFTVGVLDPCATSARRVLGNDLPGFDRELLRGADTDETQTAFRLTLPAPDGVIVRVHVARIADGGALRARLRELDPPQTIVADDIFLEDLGVSQIPRWVEGFVPGPLPSGEYVLGFYVDGGDAQTAHFAAATTDDDDDRGAPYPCPPYPLASVERVCGDTPPQVVDIEVHPFNPNTPLISLEPISAAPPSFTGLPTPAATTLVHLEAVVTDPGGRSIVEYAWESFGDGDSGVSAAGWVTHRFPHFGSFDVRLKVTNDLGLSSTSTRTIAVLPFPGPLSSGSPPEIVSLNSTPDHYVPDIAPAISVPVPGTFEVIVNAASGATITSVSGVLDDPNGGPVTFSQVGPNPSIWRGVFSDMSVLTRGESVDLIITATDDTGMMDVETFPVGLCPIPEVFGLSLSGIDRQVLYDSSTHDYTVITNYLPDRLVDFSFMLLGRNFENYLEVTASSEIFLKDMRWLAGDLDGGVEAKLMNSTLYSQAWNLPAQQTSSPVECPEFSLQYLVENIRLLDRTRSITILDNAHLGTVTVPVWVLVFTVDFFANLGLDIRLQAYLDILITLASMNPELTLDFCSSPGVDIDAEASLSARVSLYKILRLVTLTAILYPEVDVTLPSHLRIEAAPLDASLDVSHCIEVDVDYQLSAKGPFGSMWTSGRKDIGFLDDLDFGPGCGLPSPCAPGLQQAAPIGPGSVPLPSTPAIATSPTGRSLMVWSEDVDPDPALQQLELYFATDSGAGWSLPAPVLGAHDAFADTEPEVAFLDGDRAVLVWMRNSLDATAIEALAQGSLASLNTILRNQEIWFAEWSAGGGWGTAAPLTNNALAEGFPQVATVPGADTAWVTWLGYDLAQIVDESTGIPNDHESSIYAQPIVSGVPGSAVLISTDDDVAPVADFSPTIAFAPDGTGLLMWARETLSDRMLMMSAYDGSSFGTPVASYGTPEFPGVDAPSIALGSSGEGIATFTSRVTAGAASVDAGDRTSVYAMSLDGGFLGGFGAPQRIVGSRCIELSYAEEASAMRLASSSTFVVAARSFASVSGGMDVDGELAVSAIDLARPNPSFSSWLPVTSNGAIDYDVAFAMSPSGTLRSVRTSTLGDPTFGDLVPQDFDLRPDLALEHVRLSRSHPRPGSEVDVTAVIHNRGIASATSLATTLRVGVVVDGSFVEIDNQPFSFDAAAGDRQEVDYRFLVPPETTTLRIKVDVLGGETRADNNEADVVVGVRPPSNLTCTETAGGDFAYLVQLTWTGEDLYDAVLVYRNGRLRAELPGGAVSYYDDTATPGDHVYSVRGRIDASLSDPVGAVCPFTVDDCNGNGTADLIDVLTGASPDCNGNLRPDECDLGDPIPSRELFHNQKQSLTQGGSKARTNDRNANGIPDDCE